MCRTLLFFFFIFSSSFFIFRLFCFALLCFFLFALAKKRYKEIRPGSDGGKTPTADSPCECHYAGTLIDGTEFDSSYKRGQPTTFAPNQVRDHRLRVLCMCVCALRVVLCVCLCHCGRCASPDSTVFGRLRSSKDGPKRCSSW